MKKMIYNVFDGLVMAMMFAAYANALITQSTSECLILLGLYAICGALICIGQEVRQSADSD